MNSLAATTKQPPRLDVVLIGVAVRESARNGSDGVPCPRFEAPAECAKGPERRALEAAAAAEARRVLAAS